MTLNGQPGIVFADGGEVTNAVVVDVMDDRIAGVRVVANPEKLAALRDEGAASGFLRTEACWVTSSGSAESAGQRATEDPWPKSPGWR